MSDGPKPGLWPFASVIGVLVCIMITLAAKQRPLPPRAGPQRLETVVTPWNPSRQWDTTPSPSAASRGAAAEPPARPGYVTLRRRPARAP